VKWIYIVVVLIATIYIIIIAPEVFTAIFNGIGSFIEGIISTTEAMKETKILS